MRVEVDVLRVVLVRVIAVHIARPHRHLVFPAMEHSGGEGMLRTLLDHCCECNELLWLIATGRAHRDHLGPSDGEGPRLVEGDGPYSPGLLQVLAALDEHPEGRGSAQGRDDRDGCGDHERARTTHHEKDQRTVQPGQQWLTGQRWDERDEYGRGEHGGRVVPGEPIHKPLGRCPLLLCLFDEATDARECRIFGAVAHRNLQVAAAVDRTRVYVAPHHLRHGHTLARDRGLINRRCARHHQAIRGDALSRAHDHDVVRFQVLYRDLLRSTVPFPHRLQRGQVQQATNRVACAIHRQPLESLPEAEEKHHRRGLRPLVDGDCPKDGYRHQQVDIEGSRAS